MPLWLLPIHLSRSQRHAQRIDVLTGCFALDCAVFGCGVVYLAAKIQAERQGRTEDTWR